MDPTKLSKKASENNYVIATKLCSSYIHVVDIPKSDLIPALDYYTVLKTKRLDI